jgi:hypothetical protein
MIGYDLVDGRDQSTDRSATMRQLWVAAGASTDAVDIVLAKVPLGWAARLSFEVLPPEQVAKLHLRQERRGNWLFEAEALSFSFGPIVNTSESAYICAHDRPAPALQMRLCVPSHGINGSVARSGQLRVHGLRHDAGELEYSVGAYV